MKKVKETEDQADSKAQKIDGYSHRKEVYKKRILDAAEALVLEKGDVSFSTRDLAKRADVSFATPFNHFGSKLGVLDAIIERSLLNAPLITAKDTEDPLDHMLKSAQNIVTYYSKQADLYRPVFRAVLGSSTKQATLQSTAIVRAVNLWRHSLELAKKEGIISKGREVDVIADLLENNWIGSVFTWIYRSLNASEWQDVVAYNITLTLCGVVTDEKRPKLLKKAISLEKRIRKRL